MERFVQLLQDTLASIQSAEESRHRDQILSSSEGQSWKADEYLKSHLTNIITACNALSDACTKLTLFASMKPKESELQSLITEMESYVQAVICEYLMLAQSTMGRSCFVAMSSGVRRLIHHVHDLTMIVLRSDTEGARSAVGLVWKTAKEMTELPVSNKAACRRSVMQNLAVVKDTVREFDEYIQEAIDAKGEESEEESDEDDEDQQYSPEEVTVVNLAIDSMKVSLVVLKLALQFMTSAGDKVESLGIANSSSVAGTLPAVADADERCNTINEIGSTADSSGESDLTVSIGEFSLTIPDMLKWVGRLVAAAETVSEAVTDLGVELYPPVTLENIYDPRKLVKERLQAVVALLECPPFVQYMSAAEAATLAECVSTIRQW